MFFDAVKFCNSIAKMYYKHNIDAKQINNLYYSCVENKMPNISAEIETIVRQSRVLSENDFHQFLIEYIYYFH